MALVLWLFSKDILSSIFIWGYIVEASYIKFLMINDIQCTKVNTGSREYMSTRKSSSFSKIKSSSYSSQYISFDIYCIKYFLSDQFYLFELELLSCKTLQKCSDVLEPGGDVVWSGCELSLDTNYRLILRWH